MPRPRATLAALAVALLLLLIPMVSAESLTLEDSGKSSIEFSRSGSSTVYAAYINQLRVYRIQDWSGLSFLYFKTTSMQLESKTGMVANPYYSMPVTFKIGTTTIGTGTAYYNTLLTSDGAFKEAQFYIEVDEFISGSYQGSQTVSIIPDSGTLWNGYKACVKTESYNGVFVSESQPIALSTNLGHGYGYFIARKNYHWYNTIDIDDNGVSLVRNIDGKIYASNFTIVSTATYQDFSTRDVTFPATSGDWYVTSSYGKLFTGTLGGTAPTDPTGPTTVPVNIVALDSRTGNLLLDAAVEVYNETGTLVASGSTSPNGWYYFEYLLPAILTDEDHLKYYAVNITLDGWTQKVEPKIFHPSFIPRSGDWIRVEMLPDSSGPADPENTYLMFYVRDTSANGLPGAYVSIDGEYWSTNSAGHVAAEVAKNATYPYTVSKPGYLTISGTATVADAAAYTVNIVLGAGELPTLTPGPTVPGATPTPDRRTNEEKGQAVIDMIADNAEGIGALALICLLMGLLKLMVKW